MGTRLVSSWPANSVEQAVTTAVARLVLKLANCRQ